MGNAVFIEYPGSLHLALTNKHILKCAAEIEDIKGYMPGENIDGIESFTSASSLKIKWGSHKYSRLQRNVRKSGLNLEGRQIVCHRHFCGRVSRFRIWNDRCVLGDSPEKRIF